MIDLYKLIYLEEGKEVLLSFFRSIIFLFKK